jgi:hypothetical protein
METFTDVKLEIFVPPEYALKIRSQLTNYHSLITKE